MHTFESTCRSTVGTFLQVELYADVGLALTLAINLPNLIGRKLLEKSGINFPQILTFYSRGR